MGVVSQDIIDLIDTCDNKQITSGFTFKISGENVYGLSRVKKLIKPKKLDCFST